MLNKKIKHGPYDDRMEDDRPKQSEQVSNL